MFSAQRFESRCQEVGGEIFELAHAARPNVFQQAWWQQTFTNLSMHYEALKVQLFRFIDVLPVLHDDTALARHLKEYLDPTRLPMPAVVKLAVGFRRYDSLHARWIASLTRRAARMMAESFIAGGNSEEAIRSVLRFRRRSMAFTIDVLGEYTSTNEQAEQYQQTYLDLIESLCPAAEQWSPVPVIDTNADGPMPRVNISIKLTALSPHFDAINPEAAIALVCGRLRPILRRARELNAFINVDMESFAYRDLTFELFMRLLMEDEFRDMTNIGIVVQAYLLDAQRDVDRLLEWVKRREHPIAIRLVKGAYWDMETAMATQNNTSPPVWTRKWETDACYERATRQLLEHHHLIRPAFASHNVRSLAAVITTAEQLDVSPAQYEIQMLNGMGGPLKQAMVDLGQCVRVYTPYGELVSGMGYLIRRLLENTANDSFLRQSYNVRDVAPLLANPQNARPPSTAPRPIHFVDSNEDVPMSGFRNEPIISFTSADDRDKFSAALNYVRSDTGRRYPLIVDGKKIETEAWIDSTNPADPAEVVGRVADATTADADLAVAAAHRALRAWRLVPAARRADHLHKAADMLRERRFELAATITLEAGKPRREADADVAEAIDYLDYYAEHVCRLETHPRRRDLPGEDNYLAYEPKGVCVVLSPWSFPLALLANMTAAALATGNTVVVKPATSTPVIAAKLCDIINDTGLAPGVLNFLPGRGDTIGSRLVNHADVNVIAFTGSRDVGTSVLRAATAASHTQQHIKKVVAELGGKNAIIVDDDADLNEAVGGVIKSAFAYSGQKCTSCSRVIVLTGVYEAFCERLVDVAKSLTIGPADEPATVVGPLIDAAAVKRARAYIEQGRHEGHVILDEDRPRLPRDDCYVGPTIIADVASTAAIAQEELLGPVLTVIRANDFEQALDIANGTRYALTGGVYSRSPANIELAKRDFLVGNLYINRKITGSRVDVEPFGGIKMSGGGAKAGSPDYLHWFCDARTITEHTLRHGLAPAHEVQTTA